jgi:ParB/RepB/Spo0J family partition protein
MEIKLSQIVSDSPYQTRIKNDSDIQRLAESIKEDGLHQHPKVRPIDGTDKYEIVYGHNRVAACRLLKWKTIEADVEVLTDAMAHRLTILENAARVNLSPVETAITMQKARETFGLDETAKLFNVTNETVISYLRILELPVSIVERVHKGMIAKNAVPALIAYNRIMGENETKKLIEDVETRHGDVGSHQLINNMKQRLEWHSHGQFGAMENWSHNNKYDFPYDKTFPTKNTLIMKNEKITELANITDQSAYITLYKYVAADIDVLAQPFLAEGLTQRQAEIASVLIKPPVCSTCPFRVVLLGEVYCSMKLCLTRKKRSWSFLQFTKYVESSGIAIYSETKDGPGLAVDVSIDERYKNDESTKIDEKYKKLIATGKIKSLRVQESNCQSGVWAGTNSKFARLVDITPVAVKKAVEKKEARKKEQERTSNSDNYFSEENQEKRRLAGLQKKIYEEFVIQKIFDLVLPEMKISVRELETFFDIDADRIRRKFGDIDMNENNRLEWYRRYFLSIQQWKSYYAGEKSCKIAIKELIKPFLMAFGISLPDGFDEAVDDFIVENLKRLEEDESKEEVEEADMNDLELDEEEEEEDSDE